MAGRLISRSSLHNQSNALTLFIMKQLHTSIAPITHTPKTTPLSSPTSSTTTHNSNTLSLSCFRLYTCSETNSKRTTLVNFSLPSDDEDDDQHNPNEKPSSSLPPPYDPFSKKPAIEDPEDPKDVQQVFHKMRADGLQNNAVKMFDALSKDGLTHEALELFAHIKDKGHMPDVVAHTAVVEAYAAAGKPKDALKVYTRMLACGVAPNAYTYSVLIKALAADERFVADARKYLLEMMGKGMRPNAATCVAVLEAFVAEEKVEEGRELVKEMKAKGFVADEKAVKEVLKGGSGGVVRSVIDLLFGN